VTRTNTTRLCLILLCISFGVTLGGGLYEGTVLVPIWSKAPPASFTIIQPGMGVPLQRFWIPAHAAITVFAIAGLVLTWQDHDVRRVLLIGIASYVVMRIWSGLSFIRQWTCQRQRHEHRCVDSSGAVGGCFPGSWVVLLVTSDGVCGPAECFSAEMVSGLRWRRGSTGEHRADPSWGHQDLAVARRLGGGWAHDRHGIGDDISRRTW
jgi:hypothetical protein